MPELPEVETTRRFLEPVLSGATISSVEVARDRMLRRQPRPADFADRLTGRRVVALRRHGKFMLTDVEGDIVLVAHLGMSGHMEIAKRADARAPHTNVVWGTESGDEVRFVDPRTFGFVAAYTPEEYDASSIARLGPDALTELPRTKALVSRLAGRTAPLKALLVDQRFVAGIGNIYADEILHRARLLGGRPGGSLGADEVGALRSAVRPVLNAGLRWGGTSLDDLAYLLPDGWAGQFASRLAVYGREDEPCQRCATPINRVVIRGRSSYFCPGCQT